MRTTTPSASAPGDTPDVPPRYTPPRTLPNSTSPPPDVQKSTNALFPILPAHSAATDTLAPGYTRKNSASRGLLREVYISCPALVATQALKPVLLNPMAGRRNF